MNITSEMSPAALREALQFHIDLGCSECICETPIDRFSIPAATVTAQPLAEEAPQAQVFAEPAHLKEVKLASQTIQELAAAAKNLEELALTLKNFDGSPLKKTAKNMVFSDGNPKGTIMFIGEAPGREEDRQGKPFVGPSGQLLDMMLAHIGLGREQVYITNLLPWRPPGDRTPTVEEVATFMPFLARHISLVQPRLLVTVGGSSTKAVLNCAEGITKLRGRWGRYEGADGSDLPVLPIFHPAFLLRTPARKAEAWRDMCALKAKLNGR